MNCQEVQNLLSPMFDGQLPRNQAEAVREHLTGCTPCRAEFERIELLADRLGQFAAVGQADAPPELWSAIERRLDEGKLTAAKPGLMRTFRRHLALAASLALACGLGILLTIFIGRGAETAQAATIDYNVLMENVSGDVNGAIQRFLKHYDSQPISIAEAHEAAPDLSFDLPLQLPGEYRFVQAYRITLGKSKAIAATYDRAGEPLFLIFHAVIKSADHSCHTSCKIGTLQADQIEVGDWRLVHVMDETTCHCVLSTLKPDSGLEAVVKAVAPALSVGANHHGH